MDLTEKFVGPIPWVKDTSLGSPFDFRVLLRGFYFSRNFADEVFETSLSEEKRSEKSGEWLRQIQKVDGKESISLGQLRDNDWVNCCERWMVPPQLNLTGKVPHHDSKKRLIFFDGDNYGYQHFTEHFTVAKVLGGVFNEVEDKKEIKEQIQKWGSLPWARNDSFGYLTSDPLLTGPAFQFAALLDLPGFYRSGVIENFNAAAKALGIQIYDLGSLTMKGGFFWLVSKSGFGKTEIELYTDYASRFQAVLDLEKKLSLELYQGEKLKVEDKIFRSQAILLSSRRLNFLEFLECQSWLRWGVYLGLIPSGIIEWLNILLVRSGPGHILLGESPESNSEAQNVIRADMVRLTLSEWQKNQKKP